MPRAGLRSATIGVALVASIATLVEMRVRAQSGSSTFERDVAPIIYSKCASCHLTGGNAPFSLANYEEVAPLAKVVAQVARQKLMPPWKPTLGGPFVGARALSPSDILTLARWAGEGAPRGIWSGVAPPPAPPDWHLGTPDLVVALPEPYIMGPSGSDEVRTFVLPVPIKETKYVDAVEISVGPGRAVRHIDLLAGSVDSSRPRDGEDDAAAVNERVNARPPDGYLVTWTLGTPATHAGKGNPWRLEPGVGLILQVQLRKTGYLELVRPRVAFHFARGRPRLLPVALRLGQQDADVAPETPHVARHSYTLPVDVELQAMHPHASDRVTRVSAYARFPTGPERTLIQIDDWDPNWQDVYRHVEPLPLPRGTTIRVEFVYGAAARTRRNPDSPAQAVAVEQNLGHEAAEMWLQVLPKTAADRARLQAGMRD